jgi:hypothetical protein
VGKIVLNANRLTRIGAESMLIGGVRDAMPGGVKVTVTTANVTVDNAGSPLRGPEIIIAANEKLTLVSGSEIRQLRKLNGGGRAATLFLGDANKLGSGNGVLLRVSSDPTAQIVRTGVDTTVATPTLTVKAGATLAGTSLVLDSTASASIDANANLDFEMVSLNAGQIILRLDPGVAVPQSGLVLSGPLLNDLANTKGLSLLTYGSLDIYGAGTFAPQGSLTLHAAEIRGFNNGGGTATLQVGQHRARQSRGNDWPRSRSRARRRARGDPHA